MSWWKPVVASDDARRQVGQRILTRCGLWLLACIATTCFGLYDDLLNPVQIACFLAMGPFAAKGLVRTWQPGYQRTFWGHFLFLGALIITGDVGRHHLPHDVPIWMACLNGMCGGICNVGCVGVTTFLILWLFRDLFLERIGGASIPRMANVMPT